MPINFNQAGTKKPGTKTEYTPEMLQEYIKCAQDPIYFAEKYYHVVSTHNNKGKQLVKLYDFQKQILNSFLKNNHNILCAARQVGKSTISCIYILWVTFFTKDFNVAVLANKQAAATELMDDLKAAYYEMPDWLKPGQSEWNELTIKFDNGSSIMAAATSKDAIRGKSINLLYCDEFAHLPSNVADEFWTAALPTIGTKEGKCIIVSTPNGAAGLYYDLWRKATLNLDGNSFVPNKANWNTVPGRDEEWKKNMISGLGDNGKIKFAQEYELNFTGSSHTLIEGNILMDMQGVEPILTPEPGYQIWKRPQRNRIYIIGVDVAKGANSDFSVANIFDVTEWHINGKYEQVAMYRKNDVPLFDFMLKLVWLTKQWYNPVVIVENNQIGAVVADGLHHEHEYEYNYFDYDKQEFGVNANVKTKPLACTYMKDDLENGLLKINAGSEVNELGYFEEVRPGVFKARSGNNYYDDTVTSTYWVSYCLRSKYWEDHLFYLKKNNIIGNASQQLTNINKTTPIQQQDEDIANTFMKSFFTKSPENDFMNEISKY
jgi:hypothetical protein